MDYHTIYIILYYLILSSGFGGANEPPQLQFKWAWSGFDSDTVLFFKIYPLVNVYITMENHNFKRENQL